MGESNLSHQLELLPEYLSHHLLLTAAALAAGIIICLPLGMLVTRVKKLQWPVLAFASVMQTIPGIALLALMVPILGSIGFAPALLALILYSMLPILRNTVTGILGVDPSVVEAANALGMTRSQMLFSVELPLAAPVIVAGIRTATVWVVGTATLATPVGATSLGNYIFSGLQTQNATAVIVGCLAAAMLAIILDQIIRLAEIGASKRSRPIQITSVAALAIVLIGCLSPLIFKANTESTADRVVIGAKTFTEQYILAELLRSSLRDKGFSAESRTSMGSTILFDALSAGEIDLYVDYSGTIWTNVMKRKDNPPREELLREMTSWLKEHRGVTLLGPLGFENRYALAMSREDALKLHVTSLANLSAVAPTMTIGSDYEFFSRPEWSSLKKVYQLRFQQQRVFDPSLMYAAVRDGNVDVISAYSTDGRIIEYDLAVLDDSQQALPRYDAILLLSTRATAQPELVRALHPLLGSISDSYMRNANKLVDIDHMSAEQAAVVLSHSIEQSLRTGAQQEH
ncbi:MAG TPA: ABC transporter permease/substrate-binding protein [Bacteroidota bacterium]